MKHRIARWASVGFLVSAFWALYARAWPMYAGTTAWTLVNATCPIVLAGTHFHFGITIYWFFLANVVIYGLIGLAVETLRLKPNHAR